MIPVLAAPDRDLDDRRRVSRGEVLADGAVRLALRLAQKVVRLDVRVRGLEQQCRLALDLLRALVLQPERL
jgi:hypothetical protein